MTEAPPLRGFSTTELLAFGDAAGWEAWLAGHHHTRSDAWLRIAKKGSGIASVTPTEALDVALCYGWIDGQRRSHDAHHFLQRYSPRRPKSAWSKVNVARVVALTASGRMREPGLAEVRAAMADGRWDAAYEPQRTATVPPDLAAVLAHNQAARTTFDSLGRTDRYAVILRLAKVRTAAGRAAALRAVTAALEAGGSPT